MNSKIGRIFLKIYRDPQLIVKFVMEVRRFGVKQALLKTKNAVAARMVKGVDSSNFFDYYFASLNQKSDEYKEYKKNDEIDIFWGEGFTEWTNVTKAIPRFYGHYQPKLPSELGFYDLRLKEAQKRHYKILQNGDPYYNPNLTLNMEDFGLK